MAISGMDSDQIFNPTRLEKEFKHEANVPLVLITVHTF